METTFLVGRTEVRQVWLESWFQGYNTRGLEVMERESSCGKV